MDADRLRTDLLTLPHVVETMQWGGRLVFWVGDKAIGGKMFAILNLDADRDRVIAFLTGPVAYHDLLELDGITPAPYLARIGWVAAERWDVFRPTEWQAHLRQAHHLTLANSPQRPALSLPFPPANRKASSPNAVRYSPAAAKPRPRNEPRTQPWPGTAAAHTSSPH